MQRIVVEDGLKDAVLFTVYGNGTSHGIYTDCVMEAKDVPP